MSRPDAPPLSDAAKTPQRARVWLLPAVAAIGAATAGLTLLALHQESPRTVSEVRSEIAGIILRKSTLPNADDGGLIGPWWVAAAEGDPDTGMFRDFHLQSGSLKLGASRARLAVDPESGTFRFELQDVVLVAAPHDPFVDERAGGFMKIDHFTLGPVPLRGRVIHDPALSSAEMLTTAPVR